MHTLLRHCTILLAGCALWLIGAAWSATAEHAPVNAKTTDMLVASAWAHGDEEHESDKKKEEKEERDDHHDKKDADEDKHEHDD